jgi:hypothetical protein
MLFWDQFGWVIGLIVILGFVLGMRYIRYRETMTLAEKGLSPDDISRVTGRPTRSDVSYDGRPRGTGDLIGGMITTAVGFLLLIVLLPIGFVADTGFPMGFGPWLIGGLVPMFVGLALIVTHWTTRSHGLRGGVIVAAVGLALLIGLYPIGFAAGNSFPAGLGPWLLGGLIPLFVGIILIMVNLVVPPPQVRPVAQRPYDVYRGPGVPDQVSGSGPAPFGQTSGPTEDLRPAGPVDNPSSNPPATPGSDEENKTGA